MFWRYDVRGEDGQDEAGQAEYGEQSFKRLAANGELLLEEKRHYTYLVVTNPYVPI